MVHVVKLKKKNPVVYSGKDYITVLPLQNMKVTKEKICQWISCAPVSLRGG